jgi:hypothetical protein
MEISTMSVLPPQRLDQVQFCEDHHDVWAASFAQIGITSAMVTALDTLTTQARKDYAAAQQARQASKAATQAFYNSCGLMRDKAAEMIRVIKTYADTTNNPNVYTIAQIPEPAAPGTNPPPGQPENVVVTLGLSGVLNFKWKSENATGGFFQIKRKIGAASNPWVIIGGSGNREFVDTTLPMGTTNVSYVIQGFRSGTPGIESDPVGIQFGVGSGPTITGATLTMAA